MEKESKIIDPEKSAKLINLSMASRGISQGQIARMTGMHRFLITLFLNRKINLIPADIENLLDLLELDKAAVMYE